MRKKIVGVIGTANATADELKIAEEVGRLIAERGWIIVNGGLGGVMEAASRGAADAGGVVVGIIPQADASLANQYVHIPIATNMGFARNAIIAHTAQALIAVGGAYGTLTEISMGLNLGRPVFGINTWEIEGVVAKQDASSAVDACSDYLNDHSPRK